MKVLTVWVKGKHNRWFMPLYISQRVVTDESVDQEVTKLLDYMRSVLIGNQEIRIEVSE